MAITLFFNLYCLASWYVTHYVRVLYFHFMLQACQLVPDLTIGKDLCRPLYNCWSPLGSTQPTVSKHGWRYDRNQPAHCIPNYPPSDQCHQTTHKLLGRLANPKPTKTTSRMCGGLYRRYYSANSPWTNMNMSTAIVANLLMLRNPSLNLKLALVSIRSFIFYLHVLCQNINTKLKNVTFILRLFWKTELQHSAIDWQRTHVKGKCKIK